MDFASARGTRVVLDATEIHRDWYLAGLDFRLLRFLAREGGLRPVIPASVVSEVIANHDREYVRARRATLKASVEMQRLAGRAVRPEVVPERHDYPEALRQRLENLWVEVIDAPAVPHHDVVARAVARRKPFDESGTGYRDTLTWLTCVDLAEKGDVVVLVSKDMDFAGEDLALHPDLAAEVETLSGSVVLIRDLLQWLTPLSPWTAVTDPRELAALARDREVEALFAPWDTFDDVQFDAAHLGLPPNATIHAVSYHSGGALDRLDHKRDAEGADVVRYEFSLEMEVELSLRTEDAIAAGFAVEEGPPGVETITTVVPLQGLLTVVHDERDPGDPLFFDAMELTPGYVYPAAARVDDPEQMLLPFEPPFPPPPSGSPQGAK